MSEESEPGKEAVDSVSACIIARNEQPRLRECLETLTWCDEVVVVVDSRTTDRTAEIARQHGCLVIIAPWTGFARQRNLALEQARGKWILEVDADERITPALAEEIRAFVAKRPEVDMAACPRREIFLGRRLGPAAKYPNYRHRLFRRHAYRHNPDRLVHEGLWPRGRVEALSGEIEHILAGTVREAVGDAVRYARLIAAGQAETGPSRLASVAGVVVRPILKFTYRSVLYGGWRDGPAGFGLMLLESASDAFVNLLLLLRRPRRSEDSAGAGHFGHATRPRSGRIAGVAAGSANTARLIALLSGQKASGADVVLLTDVTPAQPCAVDVRTLESLSPFAVVRGLEIEDQLMPIAKTVTAGLRAALVVRLAPRHLRGMCDA